MNWPPRTSGVSRREEFSCHFSSKTAKQWGLMLAQKQRWKAQVISAASLIPDHRLENGDKWDGVAPSLFIFKTQSAGIRRFRIIPYQGSSDTSKWWVRDLAKTWRPVKISRWNFPYFIQKNGMGNTWAGQRSQHLPLVLNTPRCRYYLISFSIHWVRGDVPITLVLRHYLF